MGLLQQSDAAQQWFGFLAPGYDTVVPQLFWPDSLQQEGLERLEFDDVDSVLDIGCGTGETIGHLLPRASDVHGLDHSAQQLQTATDKNGLDEVQFVQADGHRLPYADETFDCIVSVGSILYWTTPLDVLKEAFRVTKPGGSILVMGFHRRSFSAWNAVQNFQDSLNATLFFCYAPDEASQLFQTAGWRDDNHLITGPEWSSDLVITTTATKPS